MSNEEYLINAYSVDFELIFAMEDEAIEVMLKRLRHISVQHSSLSASADYYKPESMEFYAKG